MAKLNISCIPLGAHFIYLNSGSLSGLKMAKK